MEEMVKMGKLWTKLKYKYISSIKVNHLCFGVISLVLCWYLHSWLTDQSKYDDINILKGGGTMFRTHMENHEIAAYLNALKDTRPSHCMDSLTDTEQEEPGTVKISYLVHFRNEDFYNFKLMLTSLVKYTQKAFLHEIVVLQDGPSKEIEAKAQKFFSETFFHGTNIKVYHSDGTDGEIQSFTKCAEIATGDMLVFITNHIVFNTGWVEPLVNFLLKDPKSIVVPHMDSVLEDYRLVPIDQDLVLVPTWKLSSVHYKIKNQNYKKGLHVPVMNGRIFGIHKSFYKSLGEYDGELSKNIAASNLELSFRTWLCGGNIVKVLCSHVASWHVLTPNEVEDNLDVIRTVELWFGSKNDVYRQRNIDLLKEMPQQMELEIKSRKMQLIHVLHNTCDNIDSYISRFSSFNLFPHAGSDWSFVGKIRSQAGKCLTTDENQSIVKQASCKPPFYDVNMIFQHTASNRLKALNSLCLASFDKNVVKAVKCNDYTIDSENQLFWFVKDGGLIRNTEFNLCLEDDDSYNNKVILAPCVAGKSNQIWNVIKY